MRPSISPGKLSLVWLALLMSAVGSSYAAAPAITSATSVEIYYDVENPAELLFAYRIVAAGATAFEATGLPPNATLDSATGWINGSRNVPGTYDVTVRATNTEGTAMAAVRLAIHPAAVGIQSSPGVFYSGQVLAFTVHYNTAVFVIGAPHLTLAIGAAGSTAFREAVYVSGTGTTDLVFHYTVAANEADPDGVQLLPSAPSGGSICDASGLTASPTLPVRHFVSGITIKADGTRTQDASTPVTSQLVNVSARMRVVAGDANHSLIVGFVIGGSGAKRVLLRAIGPALSAFGVPGALQDPQLRLYSSAGALVADNDDWSGSETSTVAAAVGAFALSPNTRDSAVVTTLQPGAYTLMVAPKAGDGVALAEVYDADAGSGASAIINLSTRGYVDGSGSVLIAGFAVHGSKARRILIRGIGPALTKFGVEGALADPALQIFQDGRLVAQNDDWTSSAAELTPVMTASGAFALAADSKDAATVLTLAPGSYTAVVSGAGNTSGAALVEIYALPDNG